MEISVYDLYGAVNFQPQKPTYAIRINGIEESYILGNNYPRLIESPNWAHIEEYTFDDIPPWERRDVQFTHDLASKIIDDFKQHKDKCEALFVHCLRGRNRSPAIAMALNDIFNLGVDSEKIMWRFPKLQVWVHSIMKEAAGVESYHLPKMPEEFYRQQLLLQTTLTKSLLDNMDKKDQH